MTYWSVLLMLAGAGVLQAADAGVLEDYVGLQVGSFSSEAQAKQDARYDAITWHVAEIWADDDPAERWLYTESWMAQAPAPYMQRVTRLRVGAGWHDLSAALHDAGGRAIRRRMAGPRKARRPEARRTHRARGLRHRDRARRRRPLRGLDDRQPLPEHLQGCLLRDFAVGADLRTRW